ncbi:ATP synthase subunit O, mitochondrial-like [Halichondria panicea]|uniref:ATP synthase subunit O, mitochondrial-like n=1 Tax=Halichondria panicea TaxID=6063 RepID=UPI00312B5D0D
MAATRQLWRLCPRLPLVFSQGYASAAAAETVKAPIKVFGIEGRYAHALFSAAAKQKSLDKVEKELNDFQFALSKDSKLEDFMRNPTLNKTRKDAALRGVLKEKKYSDLTVNLFGALAENNRLTKTQSVIKAYQTIMSAHRGEVPCTVTTAKPLAEKHTKELEKSLQNFTTKGQVLKLDVKVDPSIIGGMVVDFGDKFIDMSTQTKIKKIVQTLKVGMS